MLSLFKKEILLSYQVNFDMKYNSEQIQFMLLDNNWLKFQKLISQGQ